MLLSSGTVTVSGKILRFQNFYCSYLPVFKLISEEYLIIYQWNNLRRNFPNPQYLLYINQRLTQKRSWWVLSKYLKYLWDFIISVSTVSLARICRIYNLKHIPWDLDVLCKKMDHNIYIVQYYSKAWHCFSMTAKKALNHSKLNYVRQQTSKLHMLPTLKQNCRTTVRSR